MNSLTASSRHWEKPGVTATDVVLTRERDVTADSAHQTTSAQLTRTTFTQRKNHHKNNFVT